MGVRRGSLVVAVAVTICLVFLTELVQKSVARKLAFCLSCHSHLHVVQIKSKSMYPHPCFHLVSVKCYECPMGPGIKGKDCPDNRKGNLVACTQKDPICYSRVRRNKPGGSGQEVDTSWWKGCDARKNIDQGRNKIDGNTLGCREVTDTSDYCICETDRCNLDENWPKRGEPFNPSSK